MNLVKSTITEYANKYIRGKKSTRLIRIL